MESEKQYSLVAVGGTFDSLHKGHETLVKKAFDIGDSVIIGLTSDQMKDKETKPYAYRKKVLDDFLKKNKLIQRSSIIKLKDPYGLAVEDKNLNAIVVSEETKHTAEKINNIREKKCLKALNIVTIPLVTGEDNIPISSTRIKKGEIDRNGKQR